VWTELTREYLKIAPHPELSWWAARGQLVHAPGYMMNYAIGAVLVADLRERTRAMHGPFSNPRRDTYAFLSERLYRYGRARPSRDVIEAFLGRGLTTDALLRDLER
jgi:Zn-dependent M32 family carboxypeptidase